MVCRCFDPHPHEAGDNRLWQQLCKERCFDPHPREAGDRRPRRSSQWRLRFDPHPREAGDSFLHLLNSPARHVSIRTRVKRETPGGDDEY